MIRTRPSSMVCKNPWINEFYVFPILTSFRAVRRLMFRTISQIQVNYRGGPLSVGRTGCVHAGARLPWVEPVDNFAPLASLDWQVHVYGEPTPEIAATCQSRATSTA
jgi:hypothetical protein